MELLRKAKLGLIRIIEKSGKWYAQISIEVPTSVTNNELVDLPKIKSFPYVFKIETNQYLH